jgi:hypothetical protein
VKLNGKDKEESETNTKLIRMFGTLNSPFEQVKRSKLC